MADAPILELQTIDTAIDRLESRRAALRSGAELNAARTLADAHEVELGELRLRIDAIDRDAGRLEHEVETLRQKLAAERRRMLDGSVANPKELAAIQREIENIERRISDREDEELAMLEEREAVARASAEAEARATASRSEVERVSASTGSELADVERELARRRAERETLAATLPPELLGLYDDLRPQKKGVAAAALVDGVCQGCHEQLSAMELDRLRRTDGIARCEHCRRILVL
jgi:hypothetical protein